MQSRSLWTVGGRKGSGSVHQQSFRSQVDQKFRHIPHFGAIHERVLHVGYLGTVESCFVQNKVGQDLRQNRKMLEPNRLGFFVQYLHKSREYAGIFTRRHHRKHPCPSTPPNSKIGREDGENHGKGERLLPHPTCAKKSYG